MTRMFLSKVSHGCMALPTRPLHRLLFGRSLDIPASLRCKHVRHFVARTFARPPSAVRRRRQLTRRVSLGSAGRSCYRRMTMKPSSSRWSCRRHGRLGWTDLAARSLHVGRPTRHPDRPTPERLLSVVVYWLVQKKVRRSHVRRAAGFTSKHHLGIFWGFLIVTHRDRRALGQRARRAVASRFLPAGIYQPLEWLIDVFNLMVLVDDRLRLLPPPGRQAAPDPDVARRRHHPSAHRRPDDHALLLPRLPHGRRRRRSATRARSRRWSPAGSRHAAPTRAHRRRRLLVGPHRPRPGVPQLRALLQAHPHPRRAAEHLLPQPRPARHDAQAQPRGRERLGRRQDRAVHVEVADGHSTRAPSARAAPTTARPSTPTSRCRRCTSSTTCATR